MQEQYKVSGFKKTWLFFLLILINGISALASDSLAINHIGIDQGLSNNSVRTIFQDHNGFMWFGTYDGLNRYDGYGFKIFRNRLTDSTSLPHNYIYSITEDADHNLWVGTGQGIGIYNNLTARFVPAYCLLYASGRVEKLSANITVLKAGKKGSVFIGTNGWGLLISNKSTKICKQLPIKLNGEMTTSYQVQAITIDEQQRVWVGIKNIGLFFYDERENELHPVNTELKSINCTATDGEGNLWIGTDNGLYKYSIAEKVIKQFYSEGPGQLSANLIMTLSYDAHQLWIGTEGGGLDVMNTKTGAVRFFLPGENNNTISSESVYAIFSDKDSRKWIGTLKGGINIMDLQKPKFRSISHDPLNQNSLINNFAASFYEDVQKNLWIGTDGGGISIWNRKTNNFTNFRHVPGKPSSLGNNLINCIRSDNDNNIWIATYGGGVNRYEKATNTFEKFSCRSNITGDENKNIWLFLQDHDGVFWVTTFANGKIYRYNKRVHQFDLFCNVLTDVIAIMEDKAGVLWGGNSHQLIQIDREAKAHKFFETGKPVRTIYEDGKGAFWLGLEGGGLVQFDRAAGKIIRRYSDADGLCNNAVLNILEDGTGHLWLSTFNGLSRFTVSDKSFKNFYGSDGLQSSQFLYNSALKLQSGEMVFGGVKGFTIFHPDSLRFIQSSNTVFLTALRINNKAVNVGDEYITATDGDGIKALEIPYNEAVLSFDFTALNYAAPDKISYAYFLDGWDKGWNHVGNIRTASYTRLTEGSYTLRIKATNTEGVWGGKEAIIKVVVLPPWYRTIWAYAVYLLLAIAAAYLYIKYKMGQTALKYEVKMANLEKEKEKELAERKLSFFTNISHEFRTPLTLIISPLKDILKRGEKGKEELIIVYRNARRLLSLVDQLLLFQKADTEREELHVSKLDFYTLCKEVYQSFACSAAAKKIDYLFLAGNEDLEIYADREKMEIILYNLLSNAIKFTPEGGTISLTITEAAQSVSVSVSDTGPGIPPKLETKLFERFYQVPGAQTASKPGFGIGLYLVKHFAEKHKGQITYKAGSEGGSIFTISLLKGGAHFAGHTILSDTHEKSLLLEEIKADELPENRTTDLNILVSDSRSLLVVEDNKEIREYMRQIFHNNYLVYTAESGTEGLKLAEEYLPDVIISDVMMENGTGIELCQRIKSTPALSHIPVILLTGISSDKIMLKGLEGGADDYLTKPFEREVLLAKVAGILKNRNLLQNYFFNEVTLKKHNLKISSEYKEFLERCMAIVESHLEDDDFSIKKFSQEIGMSHSNLYRKVKSVSGQSVNGFIRFLRLRRAAELFIQTDGNVNEIAFQVGIADPKYFRKQFAALFGMNPSDYIKKYRPPFSKNFALNEKLAKLGK